MLTPLPYEVVYGRHSLRRRRHFHHDVGAVQGLKQAVCLPDGRLCVVGQMGVHLQRDVAVGPGGPVVVSTKEVGRRPEVLDGQRLVGLLGAHALAGAPEQGVVVIGAAQDGLFEDGRVGGDPADAQGD